MTDAHPEPLPPDRPRRTVDLNADLGEGYGPWRMGDDDALLGVVTSANVACGFHAGDPQTMRRTVDRAVERGVAVGAHVSYPDLRGFGRREHNLPAADVADDVAYQVGALQAVARRAGGTVGHVKPHGALYHRLTDDEQLAAAVVAAIHAVDPALLLVLAPGAVTARVARAAGLVAVAEGFADRGYRPDGRLVPRGEPGAVLAEGPGVADRAVRMVLDGGVPAQDGSWVALDIATLCVHGDSPRAVATATAVRSGLERAGVRLAAVAAAGALA